MVICAKCNKKIGFFRAKHDYIDGKGNPIKYCSECNDKFISEKNSKKNTPIKINNSTIDRLNYVLQKFYFLDDEKIELPSEKKLDNGLCWLCQKRIGRWFKGFRRICNTCQDVMRSSIKIEVLNLLKNDDMKEYYLKLWNEKNKIELNRIKNLEQKGINLIKHGYSLMTEKQIKKFNQDFERRTVTNYYSCNDCDYVWKSRKEIGEPAFCPRCHSDSITNKK